MAEVRCPMCGKPNPDDLDICQFCQARLKPLIIPPAPEPPTPGEPQGEPSPTTPEEEPSLTAGEGEPSPELQGGPSPEPQAEPEDFPPLPPSQPEWLQPDWLRSLRQSGGTDELQPEELPDWSTDEADEGELPESESGGLVAPESAPEASDWLDSLRPRSHVERETPEPPAEARRPQEEIPDWLERIRSRQKSEESEPPAPDTGAGSEEFLAGLRSKPSTGEKPPSESPEPEGAGRRLDESAEIPDWLADFTESEPEGQAPEATDWMKGEEFPAISQKPGETFLQPPAESTSVSETPEEVEEPDWLADLEKSAGIDEQGESPAADEAESKPEWLQGLEGEAPSADQGAETKAVPPFTPDEESATLAGEETPEWLKSTASQEIPPATSLPPEAEEGLAPAELPTWLEAMRPVEAAAPSAPYADDRDRMVESSGPLAGLRGILPAEPELALQKKAPTYSVKLQVSDSQQAHAAILTEMVKSEGIARPVPRGPVVSSQAILRVVIFILLLASIALPVLGGELGTPLPELPAEIFEARNLVNALPVDAKVIIAVDYQPGFSGELDAAAAPLVDHLMIKGAYLTLVSTATTGPAQAEHLIRSVNQRQGHQYQGINQYANLGYIAGGTSGMLAFAEAPQQVMPYALDGSLVWAGGRLASIRAISDFNLVVVITESSESARNWIEQVGPKLGDTPLLMVVSAQVEPLVRPYYQAYPRQVDGLVAGLSGGAAYESSMTRPGMAGRFWDAFSFGLPATALLILIGGLVNIIAAYLPARARAVGETKP